MEGKAIIGGIFSIISGLLGILWALFHFFYLFVFGSMASYGYDYYPSFPYETPDVFGIMSVFFITGAIFFAIMGVLAIVGGIFALRKRVWGLALAGSIAGTIAFLPTGIPAIIFVTLAKEAFSSPKYSDMAESE